MKKTFEDFLDSHPGYVSVSDNEHMRYIFEHILSRDESIIKMYHAVLGDKPALAAVVDEIEAYYETLQAPQMTLSNSSRGIQTKRSIGAMVAMLMRDFGFTTSGQKYLPYPCLRKYYVCGSVYKKTLPARLHVVQLLEEIS